MAGVRPAAKSAEEALDLTPIAELLDLGDLDGGGNRRQGHWLAVVLEQQPRQQLGAHHADVAGGLQVPLGRVRTPAGHDLSHEPGVER